MGLGLGLGLRLGLGLVLGSGLGSGVGLGLAVFCLEAGSKASDARLPSCSSIVRRGLARWGGARGGLRGRRLGGAGGSGEAHQQQCGLVRPRVGLVHQVDE